MVLILKNELLQTKLSVQSTKSLSILVKKERNAAASRSIKTLACMRIKRNQLLEGGKQKLLQKEILDPNPM
jgi:hypothetical protein